MRLENKTGENMKIKETVCAVVVTYNRKQLLIECLEAILKQTRPVDAIYIIDNCSTDGTEKLLLEKGYISELPPYDIKEPWEKEFEVRNKVDDGIVKIHYVRMPENTGGAGGFYEGVKRGYEKGYDWLWLMDDDAIPTSGAVGHLLEKIKKLGKPNIGFICSKVLWVDGTVCIMSIPGVKPLINGVPFNLYEDENVLLVESASFCSLLVNKNLVEKIGFPLREFYIWSDDVEYTLRITKNGYLGLYAKDSIVIHKTKINHSAGSEYDWRYYYYVRNKLWIYKMYNKHKYFFFLAYEILSTFKTPLKVWPVRIKACVDSLIKNPLKISTEKKR